MRYYTIQSLDKWNIAKEIGYLEGNEEYVYEDFFPAYRWMMEQMKIRLPKYKGEYPIWMWIEKPDLINEGYCEKGTKCVLLQLEISEEDVLLSSFDAYHCILNDSFLSLNDEEAKLVYSRNYQGISKEQSWERIFDLELLKNSQDWNGEQHVQGVTGRIDIKNIRVIKEFVAK